MAHFKRIYLQLIYLNAVAIIDRMLKLSGHIFKTKEGTQ